MLMVAKPAHAQGTVSGVTITFSPTTVTVPVGVPATFTATATAGTPHPDTDWTVMTGPMYSWQDFHMGNPYVATIVSGNTYTVPRTYIVNMRCVVSYSVQYARGATATIQQTVSEPITINVIGGPISGENDIYYFCDSSTSTDWSHLHAASGQPAGTTYSWSLTGNAKLTSPSTAADVTYAGSGAGSTNVGDVKATVTYSLNGVSATSDPFPITVHAPVSFVLNTPSTDAYTKYEGPGPSDTWGFDGEHLYFTINDGLGQPMRSSQHQAYWDESWDTMANGNGPLPASIGAALDDTGSSKDTFSNYGSPVSQSTNSNGDKLIGPLIHGYYVTDDGAGYSGGKVGCKVKVYINVTYNTYGMVGNDLPAPTR